MPDGPDGAGEVFNEDEIHSLLTTPPEVIIGNHVFHLLELAALHLSAEPPHIDDARLTIDAVAGLMTAVGDRLGEHGPLLAEALSQIRLAFVQVTGAQSPA